MSKLVNAPEFQYSKVPTNETKKKSEKPEIPTKYGYGTRHIQLIIVFLCLVTSFIARGHLGVTLVAMTTNTDEPRDDGSNKTDGPNNYTTIYHNETDDINYSEQVDDVRSNDTNQEFVAFNSKADVNFTAGMKSLYSTFVWPKCVQEMVLTSFFVGYGLGVLPVSLVTQRWGGKLPLQISMLANGLVSIVTPTLAYWGNWQAVCVCRFLQGISQSGTYPSIQMLLAHWVPDCEKGTLSSYVYTGSVVGSVMAFQIGGIMSAVAGWPASFWTIGVLCLILFILITVYGAASPRVHKTITEEERCFIIGQTGATALRSPRVPWKDILTSKPLMANYSTAVGSGVSFVFFFTQLPSYIHYIYGVDVQNSGMITSLPYIVGIFSSIAFGVISDYLMNHNIMSRKNVRRYSNLLSQTGTAVSLVGASYACNSTIAVLFFVMFILSQMGTHTGWMINQIDLSPNYSGTLIAVSNCAINVIVMIMPFVISNVIIDMKNVFQWRIIMLLEAAVAFIPSVIFAIYISDEVQPWNNGNESEQEKNDMKMESIEKLEVEKKEAEHKADP